MKINSITSVILLIVYSLSSLVGIGIFHCGCTNSQQLVFFTVKDASCPLCTKSADVCCSHNEPHHDEENDEHEDGCCSLEYQYVDADQLIFTQFNDAKAKILTLLPLSADCLITSIKECFAFTKIHSPPLKIPLIYLHAQLRL